jgi:hypothetical protein
VPAWLARLVLKREPECVWPGCGQTRGLQMHHFVHWADGGPTDLENIGPACGVHHHRLHEGRWSARRRPDGSVEVTDPSGRVLEPPRFDGVGDVVGRLTDLLPRAS